MVSPFPFDISASFPHTFLSCYQSGGREKKKGVRVRRMYVHNDTISVWCLAFRHVLPVMYFLLVACLSMDSSVALEAGVAEAVTRCLYLF